MDTFAGLPAHPLLVHAPVVLVPVVALLVILMIVRPQWLERFGWLDNRNRLFPLYSLPATRVAFAIGSHRRRLEALPFELIRATCPDLATLPFAPSAWPASLS